MNRRVISSARVTLEQFLQIAPDPMIVVDQNGRILMLNSQVESLFGYSREEVVDRAVEILVPERFRQVHGGERDGYFLNPRTRPMGAGLELFALRKDGTEFPVEISLSPLQTEHGTVAITAIRDITDRKKAEEGRAQLIREQAARIEAEAANRAKDEFLITLSHELRTPLNAIRGWIYMLRSGTLDAKVATQALETIDRNARLQVQLIEDLLDVSRIISGKLHLEMGPLDLNELVESTVNMIKPAAVAQGLRLFISTAPTKVYVDGDPDRLQQVINNLLSNAIKFTPRGGRVEVGVESERTTARILVSDSGKGIAPEALPHIFDQFWQADSSSTRSHGGLGIGLAILRHLVDRHGGTVKVESSGEGRGATFIVSLPALQHEPAARAEKPAIHPASRLDGLKVLVVDDQADERELFKTIFQRHGAQVQAVSSARDAFDAVRSWQPHVIVSDIGMPDIDGYGLIRMVRSLGPDEGGQTPAVAVTAYARMEDKIRALTAGFQGYVAKPVNPKQLVEAASNAVSSTTVA